MFLDSFRKLSYFRKEVVETCKFLPAATGEVIRVFFKFVKLKKINKITESLKATPRKSLLH